MQFLFLEKAIYQWSGAVHKWMVFAYKCLFSAESILFRVVLFFFLLNNAMINFQQSLNLPPLFTVTCPIHLICPIVIFLCIFSLKFNEKSFIGSQRIYLDTDSLCLQIIWKMYCSVNINNIQQMYIQHTVQYNIEWQNSAATDKKVSVEVDAIVLWYSHL